MRDAGEQPLVERLIATLCPRDLLLVLDNCEQVPDAAPYVGELLHACPRLTVLATSRTPLRLSGEREFPVPPLSVPQLVGEAARQVDGHVLSQDIANSEAVRLFVERARAVLPAFALTEDNAGVVAEICRRLDGLPLAIELAAARVKLFPPTALLARLERRLPLLIGGPRDAPQRLRTMRDAIAWSYDLLAPEAQALFRRLSAFAGGFTLEAAEAVATSAEPGAEVAEGLAILLDASLVSRVEEGDASAETDPRFTMLETVREFGLDQLLASGEADEIRRRHAAWCVALAERAAPELRGSASDTWIARLVAEHDNLRAALDWATDRGESDMALRLGGALRWFWFAIGHLREGRDRLHMALATPGSGSVSPSVRALALIGVGHLAINQGDFAPASASLDGALALYRQIGDQAGEANVLQLLGTIAEYSGDEEQATIRYEQALALYRALDATREVSLLLENLADAAFRRGELSRSEILAGEALALARTVGDVAIVTQVLVGAAQVANARSDQQTAAALLAESLARVKDSRFWLGWAETLGGCAAVAAATGQATRAGQLLAAAMAICETIGMPRLLHHEQYLRTMAAARSALGDDAFAAAWAAGQSLPLEAALALATAICDAPREAPTSHKERPFDLTPRELDVLRLLAEGRSDKEIGAALFISHRTAMNHVARILDRLDVPSRSAAVREASRHGLL